jgi:hypothetical protein
MATDETPRQPQALQAGGRLQSQAEGDAGHGAYPEQVFAGESGDPIWEPLGTRAQAGQIAPPRVSPDETVPAGRIIDLVQPQPAKRPRPSA